MDSGTNWIDVDSYNASEVYVLASALDRSRDSATAQLQGLFGIPFALPLPDITATGYETSLPTALEDYILSVQEDPGLCPRY